MEIIKDRTISEEDRKQCIEIQSKKFLKSLASVSEQLEKSVGTLDYNLGLASMTNETDSHEERL